MTEEEENKKQEEAFLKDMEKMKGVADSMIDVAFNITLFDIEKTLRKSIKKIFQDQSIDKKGKQMRAQGLLMIGKIFMKYGESDTKKGLKLMKEQLSGQMEAA